jgi:hypothetical protein
LLGRVDLAVRREIGGIDHFGARFLQRVDAAVQERIERGIVFEEFAGDAETRAAQAAGIEETRVVRRALPCSGFLGIGPSRSAKSRVANRARHRTGGVLAGRDGDDAGAADESDGGLDAGDAVDG